MCSNINTHNGFLKISKRCRINCINEHITPHIYNSCSIFVCLTVFLSWLCIIYVSTYTILYVFYCDVGGLGAMLLLLLNK